jgi:hypothetical protein
MELWTTFPETQSLAQRASRQQEAQTTTQKSKEKSMSKSKTPKKSDATAEKTGNGSVAIADRPSVMDPLRRVDSWFDQWPSLFARRFPDLLAHPMATMEPMRVEEFVDGDEFDCESCVAHLRELDHDKMRLLARAYYKQVPSGQKSCTRRVVEEIKSHVR